MLTDEALHGGVTIFRVAALSHTEQPYAVFYRHPRNQHEELLRFFATFADADVYRQKAMAAEKDGKLFCNGCLATFTIANRFYRHQAGCGGAE